MFPQPLQARVRMAASANLNAFFDELRNIWLETAGGNMEQQNIQVTPQPHNGESLQHIADIAVRLGYQGNTIDSKAMHDYIHNELSKRLSQTSQHIRKNPSLGLKK